MIRGQESRATGEGIVAIAVVETPIVPSAPRYRPLPAMH
jgi:hypothetical protein